jgi:cytoskeletal protein CcmA (bactofilin family)
MALQGPFFGKRDGEQPLSPPPVPRPSTGGTFGAAPHPASPAPAGASVSAQSAQSLGIPSSMPDPLAASSPSSNSAKLIVGPNIKLKGVEIADCDTLVIEGLVEATVNSRVIQIAEPGAYKGSAEIDIAEVRGAFDGNLTARQKLVIFATGKVSGKIRYGKIVIEEGGQISGDVTVDAGGDKKPVNHDKAPSAG